MKLGSRADEAGEALEAQRQNCGHRNQQDRLNHVAAILVRVQEDARSAFIRHGFPPTNRLGDTGH